MAKTSRKAGAEAGATTPGMEAVATTPAAQPTVAETATPVMQPTIEKKVEPVQPEQGDDGGDEDDTFAIREREFLRYVTKRVEPVISAQAKTAGVAGPVVVEVYLSKQGYLSKASVIEGEMLLRESALAALRQWSFRPYYRDRVPADVRSEVTIYVR